MSKDYTCGYITIDPKKKSRSDCFNKATWVSPKRIHTEGTLKVCGTHRDKMDKEYRDTGIEPVFTPIGKIYTQEDT